MCFYFGCIQTACSALKIVRNPIIKDKATVNTNKRTGSAERQKECSVIIDHESISQVLKRILEVIKGQKSPYDEITIVLVFHSLHSFQMEKKLYR